MTSEKLLSFWTALKTILSNVLGVAGALFILVSIIGFMEGGEYSPTIGSGIGLRDAMTQAAGSIRRDACHSR